MQHSYVGLEAIMQTINVIHPISGLMEKTYMIISNNTEKALDKMQYL